MDTSRGRRGSSGRQASQDVRDVRT